MTIEVGVANDSAGTSRRPSASVESAAVRGTDPRCPSCDRRSASANRAPARASAYATMGKGPPLVRAAHFLTQLEFELRTRVWRGGIPRGRRCAGLITAPPSALFAQERKQPAQRLAAVADGVLLVRGKLGRRLAESGKVEMGVVAEAAGATRRGYDLPMPAPLRDQGLGVVGVAHQDHHTIVVSAPVGAALEQADELLVVALIGLRLAREPRRVHARLARKGGGADPGVVRERRKPSEPRCVPRLGEGVLDEGRVRLLGVRDPERALWHDLDAERCEELAELPDFAGVRRGEDQRLHGVDNAAR